MYFRNKENRIKEKYEIFPAFINGIKDAVPIGAGYFAVSFSMGIAASKAGLTAIQGMLSSFFIISSTGQYALYTLIGSQAPIMEAVFMTIVANARYLLMSCVLASRLRPDTSLFHRLFMGIGVTDELFGIAVSNEGYLNPFYSYGAMTSSVPFWAAGTTFGIVMGNILPRIVVSPLSVALYGMFIAIIIPPSRKDKRLIAVILSGFILSFVCRNLTLLSEISDGTKTIILTVAISTVAAIVSPVKDRVFIEKNRRADEFYRK